MRKWLILIPVALLLTGCRPGIITQTQSPVVTQILVDGEYEDSEIYREYETSDKIRQILLYIRALRPRHSANVDVELLEEPEIRIMLIHRDGAQKQYRLKAGRYLQSDGETWKKVDEKRVQQLCQLLWELPGDVPN